jgi:hypothetical protein
MANEKQITVAQVKKFYMDQGLALPEATTYFPKFRDDVYAAAPNGQLTPYSPTYCLEVPSAMALMLILEDLQPVGYLDPPVILAGGGWSATAEVPWFVFQANGAVRNGGQVAQYWLNNSGDPGGNTAESRARQDIAWG